MTNLEKMNELVGSEATKDQIVKWAYMNRIYVGGLYDEGEFSTMELSVLNFMESDFYNDNVLDEFALWDMFLESKFVQ
jgi:hypothetical protein